MKLLIHSANLGSFDKPKPNEPQNLSPKLDQLEEYLWTDSNFPPRKCSMAPRLQARIPKMFAWSMKPGFDYYLWHDASVRLAREDSVKWFLDKLGDADVAFFKHPDRENVGEEAEYLKERLVLEAEKRKKPYILPRYENERIDDQIAVVDIFAELLATTAFIYKDTTPVRDMLTIWWTHTSLYHSIDQLSLPTAIKHSGVKHNVIPDVYYKCKYLESTRQ